jgi:hypothetical protein
MRPGSEPSSKPWNGDRRPGRAMGKSMGINMEFIWILYLIYIYMMVDQNSFFRERPFFTNKNVTFAKLSRTPPFAEPMFGNHDIQLSRNFHEKKCYFRELEKKLLQGFPT